jgi:hypothetical protein
MDGAAQHDLFVSLGKDQMVASAKRKLARQEARQGEAPMVPTATEKKLRDQQLQMRRYNRWRRAAIRTQLEGPHRDGWRAMARELRSMTIDTGPALVEHVRHAQWLRAASVDERYLALSVISSAIVRLRIRNGYSEFSDSLPGEELTAYELIRAILLDK